jgi:DNA invertase Pin-like site-specific DNA recombinase
MPYDAQPASASLAGRPAISYARISTKPQEQGRGLDRQRGLAEATARRFGLILDDRRADVGMSGYHGAHRKAGALRALLDAAERGEIERGTVLLVENLDRLSREEWLIGIDSVRRLVDAGLVLITCHDSMIYDQASLRGGAAFLLVGHLQRAHMESERKAEMANDIWNERRADPIKNRLPRSPRSWTQTVSTA